jgi:hypothetical protein
MYRISCTAHTLRIQMKCTPWVSNAIQNDVYSLKLNITPCKVKGPLCYF